ncbi:hypothetical protein D3C87_1723310 [compost metagenome]
MQEVTEGVFDALQGYSRVVVGDFAEVEEDVIEGLQQVMAAFGANQIDLFVRVVDALARLHVHEGHGAPLVVGQVNETAAAPQALFPRQHPALAEHTIDAQVTGIEA